MAKPRCPALPPPGEAAEGDPAAEQGRAERHRQPRAAGLVLPDCSPLPSRLRAAPKWCPHGCPHGNGGVTAISPPDTSCLLFHRPCEAASAPAHLSLCAGPAPHVLSCRHPSLSDNNSSHRSSFNTHSGWRHHGLWNRPSAPVQDLTLPHASNHPFPKGGDVKCHKQKCAPGPCK